MLRTLCVANADIITSPNKNLNEIKGKTRVLVLARLVHIDVSKDNTESTGENRELAA